MTVEAKKRKRKASQMTLGEIRDEVARLLGLELPDVVDLRALCKSFERAGRVVRLHLRHHGVIAGRGGS